MASEVNKDNFVKELKNKLGQKAYGSLTEESVLLKAFKYFDLDNSGTCSKDEFLRTMFKIGITGFSENEILDMFNEFDEDKSGVMDYREFVSMLYGNKSITGKKGQSAGKEPKGQETGEPQDNYQPNQYQDPDSIEGILDTIRGKLASRGVQGICSLARNFRIIDDNNSQTIDLEEFKKCCKDFQLGLNDRQIQTAFAAFDRDNSGVIDYDEFLRAVRGEMNDFRRNIVQQAFNKIDKSGNGEVSFDEVQSIYNAKQHPDVRNGRRRENDVIQEFMDTFQDTYNYLCGTENDNKITIEEFMEYYENVSMSIDDDAYFELLMNNCWGLGENTTSNNNKKGWSNKYDEGEPGNNDRLDKRYQDKFGDRRPGQTEQEARKEREELPIKKFKKEILKRGGGGLISLARQFKIFDDNGNKQLDLDEFTKAIQEFKLNLTPEEIEKIFNIFDKDGTGFIDYDEFIREIRGPMNEKRTAVVKQAFNKLDIDKSGVVDIYEIKSQYNAKNNKDVKSGRKTEEEVYSDFIETFQSHHYLKSGVRSKRVTLDEFLEYYNMISMGIDDDDYFVFMVQNAWKLNPQTNSKPPRMEQDQEQYDNQYDNQYSQPPSRQENIRPKGRDRDFNTRQAPYGTDEEEPPKRSQEEPKIDTSTPAIERFRNIIAKRGTRGIMSARREFMIADDNNSKTIDLLEFKKFCHDYRIPLGPKEVENIFKEFDTNRSGEIDYDEFLRGIMGEMNDRRKRIVKQVFNKFDKNGNGLIELDDVRDNYNAKNHPDVRSGKKTEDEVLAEFLDTFEYQFSLLNDIKNRDGKITLDEFMEYYNNISMSIDDDDYFEEMIKSAYNLDNRRTNKKAWRGEY